MKKIISTALIAALLLPQIASAAAYPIAVGGTGTSSFSNGILFSPGTTNYLRSLSCSTGQLLIGSSTAPSLFECTATSTLGITGSGSSNTYVSPLNLSGSTVTIQQASSTQDGFLSKYNWNSFWNAIFPRKSESNYKHAERENFGTSSYAFDDFGAYNKRWRSTSGGSINASEGVMTLTTPAGNDVIAVRTLWSNILKGYDTINFEINFNGNTFLTAGDTPLLSFEQSGDKGVVLTNWAANGSSSWQSVSIPLTKFTSDNNATSTYAGTGTPLDPDTTVTNFKVRIFESVANKTFSIRNVTLTDSTGTLVQDFTQPDLLSQPKPGNSAFRIQSVDFMKVSKDNVAGQYTDTQMRNLLNAVEPLNLTHVAISIPYDDPEDYPSPVVSGYQMRWANAIREKGYNVFWRQHPNAWEGDYSTPKATSTVGLGNAADVLDGSDTTSYLAQIYTYIINHPEQYAPGDIITPMAEPENGGINGVTTCTDGCQFASANEFRHWLMDGITVTNAALERIGLKGRVHVGYYGNSGFIVWGNGSNPKGFLDERVADAFGIMSVDNYPNPYTDIVGDMEEYETIYGERPLVVTEYGTINESSTSSQQAALDLYLDTIRSKPYVYGFNYWSATGGAHEDLIGDDFVPIGSFAVLQDHFTSGKPLNIATALQTILGTNPVDITGSYPPKTGMALIAVSTTSAKWQYPAFRVGSGFVYTATSTDGVRAAYVTATSSTATSTFAGVVGIGTTSPIAKLSVTGSGSLSPLLIASSTNSRLFEINQAGAVLFGNSAGTAGQILQTNGATGVPTWVATSTLGIAESQWTTNGTSVYYNGGNVGVGTVSPEGSLHIAKNIGGTTNWPLIIQGTNSSSLKSVFLMRAANGSIASPSQLVTNDVAAQWSVEAFGAGNSASSYGGSVARLKFVAEENFTSTSKATAFVIDTTPTGSATGIERLRVTGAGDVGIGTESPGGVLHIVGTGFPVLRTQRNVGASITSTVGSSYELYTSTSGNMADGFGGGIVFSIGDAGISDSQIATLYGIRDGSDSSGALTFNTYLNGTRFERMRLTSAGNVGIGTTTPGSQLVVPVSLEIPATTTPALSVTRRGNIAININQASSSLEFHDGTARRVINTEKSFVVALNATSSAAYGSLNSATTTVPLGNRKRPLTVISAYCKSDTGTLAFRIGDGTNWSNVATCSSSGVSTTFNSNNMFNSREDMKLEYGSQASSPTVFPITIEYRESAE